MVVWALVPPLSSVKECLTPHPDPARDSSSHSHKVEAWLSYCGSWSSEQKWILDRFGPLRGCCLDQIWKYYNIGTVFSVSVSNTRFFEDTVFAPYM